MDEVGIKQERMGYLRQVVPHKQRQGGRELQSLFINRCWKEVVGNQIPDAWKAGW